MARSWVEAVLAAGAVPASHVPEASLGRSDLEEFTGADPVEDPELRIHSLAEAAPLSPAVVRFLDGIEQWRVVGYAGVTPIVRAYIAAAVRRRGPDRRLRTVAEDAEEFAVTRLDRLPDAVRAALVGGGGGGAGEGVRVVEVPAEDAGQPGRALPAARVAVQTARAALERRLAERCLATLRSDEWLVVDGVLSDSAALSAHGRALGVVKSHGAQYFEGAELERALTLPAGHRTSVFRPRSRGARRAIYSWYLRLWPWQGNDLLYGLVRLERRAHPDTVAHASGISAWLLDERAPVSTPDRRWDRLLYPIHDVETYLRARAPRDLTPPFASRLPRTGS
ncbi:MAG TPA: hypothetical protein VEM13_01745 [Gemmatimonadales bacterium]|nr:hypothetical protein [Gemmatimonadales bacterium]